MKPRTGVCGTCLLPRAQHARRVRRTLPATTRQHLRTCDRVRETIARLWRGIPDRCRFCDRERRPGRTVCDFHLVLSTPCEDCGGPVQRHEGRGRQPEICAACDLKRYPSKQRHREDEVSHGG